MKKYLLLSLSLVALLFASCGGDETYSPKPTAYLRIEMPQKEYRLCDTAALPFTFEYATAGQVSIKKNLPGEKFIDINYPQYAGAVVYLTYKGIGSERDLQGQIDTAYRLLSQHFDYSTGVRDLLVDYPKEHVYTTTYHITGQRAASPCQFYATDSAHHFLRGSLFFGVTPNNDSLDPVIKYIEADIDHLLATLHWRE